MFAELRTANVRLNSKVVSVFSLVSLLVACNTTLPRPMDPPLEHKTVECWGFTLFIPSNCTVKASRTVHDFDLYNVLMDDTNRCCLSIYAGFHPSFPKYAPKRRVKNARVAGERAESIQWTGENPSHSREVLVHLNKEPSSDGLTLPMYLHLMYYDLSEEDAVVANRIIQSITKNKSTGDGLIKSASP